MGAPDLEKLRDEFADYLYSQVPNEWRNLDLFNQKQFYRYLQIVQDGGFRYMVTDMEFVLTFTDPITCPEKYLPILFASFGFPYFYDIPVQYQRRLISNILWLYKTKGTKPCIEYLARELSGYDVEVDVTGWGDYDVLIRLLVDENNVTQNPQISVEVLQRLLEYFLPVFSHGKVIVTYLYDEEVKLDVETWLRTHIQTFYDELIHWNTGSFWTDRRFRYTSTGYFASLQELAERRFDSTFIDDRYDADYLDLIDKEDVIADEHVSDNFNNTFNAWTDRRFRYTTPENRMSVPTPVLTGSIDTVIINGEVVAIYYN